MALKEYDIAGAFQAVEYELINSFLRNMKRHRVEEVKEQKQWEMWQVKQLQELDLYKKRNAKKYGARFVDINKTVAEMIRLANEEGQMDQETEILEAMKEGLKTKRASKALTAQFFRTNERKLNALIDATTHDMEAAETAILRKANDVYRKTIFNAQVYANTGAGTYEKAVDMATKDLMAAGLTCVEYKNGARHTLPDYADMALRTANKRAYLQGEGAKRQEWGIHTVIVNKRLKACPHCMPFAGKVFIDDVWGGGTKEDGNYPLLSTAIEAGLYHPRCRDSHTAYFPGITDRPGKYTKAEVKAAERAEEKEEKENYARRQAEKHQRLADTRLDQENRLADQRKANQWKEETAPLSVEKRIKEVKGDTHRDLGSEHVEYVTFKKGEREIKCVDITSEFLGAAKPGEGIMVIDPKTEPDDRTTTKWLYNTFGGDIHCLDENSMLGKMPDALWNDEYWEYKAPSTVKAIDTRIRKGIKQIEEALSRENRRGEKRGLVIDVSKIDESNEVVIKEIAWRAVQRYKGPTTIIVKDEKELIGVLSIK